MEKTLNNLKNLVVSELEKINAKGTMSPVELDNATKAVCLLEKIEKTEMLAEESKEIEEMKSSGAPRYYYPMHGVSHRDGWRLEPYPMYPEHVSGARGRSATTGRYVSRDGHPYHDTHSGHSINDRMVSALERMMDTATSEYEREQILDKIRMIRNSPDTLD